ncbi:MAG TPA: HEAT repeat domain-containing protein [Kofleriaceae bacterium]|nr:HEAT repeat domain-containing protein [Kofleriaceae bacterium]
MRRLVALYADGSRMAMRPTIVEPEIAGPLASAEVEQRFADYVLDSCGSPLVARSAVDETWFAKSLLLDRVAPGNAIAIGDDVAAVVAAPRLVDDGKLGERLVRRRFASRADDAVAAAVSLLPAQAAVAAVVQLALQHGPDEDRLHLALLQAASAVAWRPELLEGDGVSEVLDAALQLFDRKTAKPLLDTLAPTLGAIAASPSTLGKRVRDTVIARFDEGKRRISDRRSGSSFLGEFRALDRTRSMPDEDYYMTLPDRQLVEVGARILGRSAVEIDRDAFVALQGRILDGDLGTQLLPSFVDGLIGAAAIGPLAELVAHLLRSPDAEPRLLALQIAAQLPLDACAEPVLACLQDDRKQLRIRAARAVAMLEPERAVPALLARLDDPEPEVCASSARALVALGQDALIDTRRMPGGVAIGKTRERTAVARAALGDTSTDVISALLPLAVAEAERKSEDDGDEDLPIVTALATVLRGSAEGIRLAAEIMHEIPDALPIVALALVGDDDVLSVALPADLHADLGRVLDPLIEAGDETGMVALETLARFSRGDTRLLDRIVRLGERYDGYAGQLLNALAHVRRRSEGAATLLAPFLDNREYMQATVTAAAVAGVVLPENHPLWAQVRELYELGSLAGAVAHASLESRVRVRCED